MLDGNKMYKKEERQRKKRKKKKKKKKKKQKKKKKKAGEHHIAHFCERETDLTFSPLAAFLVCFIPKILPLTKRPASRP